MRILGPPSANYDVVRANLIRLGAHDRFVNDMLPALWMAAVKYAIDPPGMVSQAFKETGGGKFGGKALWQFHNTCGLKLRYPGLFPESTGDMPLAHSQFASWDVGAEAHAQHLRAYTGCAIDGHLNIDPRWVFVWGKYRVETFEELGGKWAPSPSYGTEIVDIAGQLRG
jgi:hypothetical protein